MNGNITVGETNYSTGQRAVTLVNPIARAFVDNKRYVLWFGAYGETRLMVWARSLESALDECVDWIADNAPGLLADDGVHEQYKRLVAEGVDEEKAQEEATVDTTCAGNNGHYLNSWEWGIVAENPTRAQVLEILGR